MTATADQKTKAKKSDTLKAGGSTSKKAGDSGQYLEDVKAIIKALKDESECREYRAALVHLEKAQKRLEIKKRNSKKG